MSKKKAKRYDDGGDVETQTAQGQNANIGDDVRARAMAAMANQAGSEPSSTPKATPKAAAPKAAAKEEAAKPAAAPTKQQKNGPTMMRGDTNTGVDLKKTLFGGSSDSPRMRAAKRSQASNASNYSMKSGGKVGSASSRGDGIAMRGKTRGKIV
jgi:hypothetical protein